MTLYGGSTGPIFFYMVQAFLVTIAGCKFFNIKTRVKQTILVSIIYGIVIWVVRGVYSILQIPYGTHTLILAICYCLLLLFIMRINFTYCLGVTGFGFSLVLLSDGLVGIFLAWSGESIDLILGNVWLHIIFGHIENLLLIIYLVLDKFIGLSLNKMVRSCG